MTINYTCKFCRRPFSFECDFPEGIPFDLPKWISILACNPCADYERGRRDTQEAIGKEIAALMIARRSKGSAAKLALVEETARRNLIELTKRYASVICAHAKKPNYWEPVFVEHLMARPDLAGNTLSQYRRSVLV